MANEFRIKNGYRSEGNSEITGSLIVTNGISGSFSGDGSGLTGISTYIDNLVTVGLSGSETNYFSIKSAVDSITDASAANTYTVRVSPGVYIESEMTVPSYVAIKGDSSISTIVSASNPSSSIFIMSDQSMVIDMQIQGSTAPGAAAIIYSSPTTPQTNAIAYVENVRFGTNYTNAKVIGTGSNGNCILQCSNVKYGGFTELNKSFDVGFHVTRTGSSGIGRMQLRNVTSTNGGVAGTDNNQIFALSDAPSCAVIVNGCLLTRAAGSALGTGFKVYNGGNLRLTGVNFQRWDKGIWAPQTGSGPSIDAIALNFENCTTDVLIEHTGSTGKVQGTDNFLKTQISLSSSLYEVGQDPRRITVGTKGADFTSISASVAYITDSSDSNRYVIEVGPGKYIEKEINLTGKPYVSIVGSSIQTTQIFPSSSNQHLIRMGVNNEISFLSLTNAPAGYSALYVDDVGDYAQAHKVSFYDCDTCLTVISRTQDTKFYGEYLDYNGVYSTGSFVSSSNGYQALASLENYYQFPVGATGLIANYGTGDVAELDLYAAGLIGEGDATSVAIRLENGADLQGLGMDLPAWGSAVYIPNLANSASFNIVGSMIHDSVNYDFEILHPSASCRFQGTADHSKINNVSQNFFWTFLDENDGELDITRKLSVTFADGTHTDASTLIFEGSPMGVMSGGNITISGSLTITTAAGYGYLHNMGTEVFQRIDWANSNLTLSPNTNNYIFIDSTATLTSSPTQPDSAHNIILGRVVTNDTGIELVDNSPYFAAHMSNALSKFNRNALGPVFAEGGIVSEDVTPRQLDVTAGLYYFGENEYDPTGGSAITFTQYYQSGSGAFGWNKSTQTVVPNNTYNSGSALTAMSASYYTKHTLYTVGKGPDEEYFLVVGQTQYASLVEAEDAGLPTPPTYFSDGVAALASIYVQSGSTNLIQVQDIRPIIGFRAAGVNASSVHANLLGLNSDDHPQYLLTNGSRVLTGNLDLGGYNVVNAASISSNFTGSLQGTASWALNAITASYALNAGTTINTGSLLTTASVSLNTITFTKGDGSTFPITVVTGSGISDFPYTGSAIVSGSLLVTGSFSVLDSLGVDNINTAVRSLYGTNGVTSVDWNNRLLNGLSGNNVVDWRNLRLIDSATTRSIDWGSRTLQDSTQTATLDWNSGRIYLSNRISIDWGLRKLYDTSPILSVDWTARTLHDTSTTQSADWNNRYLIDNSSIQSIDWQTREAFDTNQSSSINWNGRLMRDSGAPGGTGVPAGSIDWENRQTLDAYSILSSDWNNRYLSDGASTPSIYWNSRTLSDSIGNGVTGWDVANQFNAILNNYYQITNISDLDGFAQPSQNVINSLTQNLSGEVIPIVGNLDAAVGIGNLVYLNSDGIWYKTDQTSVSSSYMLGVCIDNTGTKEKVFLEGNIGFTTASVADSPLVTGTNFYGVPIYISGSNGAMSTEKPTSGIVRIVGHAFYNSVTTPTNWLMKFRPSNDWYEI